MEKLSAVILTFNEERNIARCIESVAQVADEILVVDSFSVDRTAAICKELGVRFVQHPFEGYIEQKNYALQQATHKLVLSLDADEALSPELIDSIKGVKTHRKADGYTMNRLTNYCGKWIHHSGWYPDTKLRLLDRSRGKWGGVNPHDKIEMNSGSTVDKLQGDILHYSYYTFEEHRAQIIKFAEISARSLHESGTNSSILKIFYKPVARFLRSYIVKAGFLDGKEGWTIAYMTAWSSYLRYSQLYKIQK